MLVLSRKSQEAVVVGGHGAFAPLLRITVLDITAGRVRLGFDVAADIPVIGKKFGIAFTPKKS